MRVPARTGALACLLLVLTACGRPELADPTDARPLDVPPSPALTVDTERVPDVLGDRGLWTAPYASEPKASDDGFVGLVFDDGGEGLRFLGVDSRGHTRWSTPRNPSCTGFTLTRTSQGDDLVVLLDSDAAPERGLLATTITAAAYDPSTGHKVWGPTEVPGTWVGPGLVFAQISHTVMSEDTGPKVALAADTGAVVADEKDGDVVLHEYQGTLLVHRDGDLRAIDTSSGEQLWRGTELPIPESLPEETGKVTLTYGHRPRSDSAGLLTLRWERGEASVYTVHDPRDGRLLAELSPRTEPVTVGNLSGRTVVAGVSATTGAPVLLGRDAPSRDGLWTVETRPGERPVRIVSGLLYTTADDGNRVLSMTDGHTLSEGTWEAPVAGPEDGPVLVGTVDPDGNAAYVAVDRSGTGHG
ncbi:PQQ-binding-like beta-propeller repeat protein [Nocardiopsis halotolerans]|uniref:PQQ-binding-like beta-propeller repeat protein n=1 Tax=Nocardiopsis halotolerans TaxID=124252 RepID=UPI000347A5D2|nr:PQQ-binding-like beta-propeller repeat protein [Nocardiopsis halotolerans]